MPNLDFSQIIAAKLNGEDVIRITDTVNTLWELQPAFTDYLSFTDTSGAANRFALSRVGVASSLPDVSIEYSFDKTNWQTWVEENATRTLTIPANGTVYLRGNNQSFNINSDDNRYTFGSSGSVAAGGDIVSLVSADGTATALPNHFCRCMFKGMTTLTKAPKIGATTFGSAACRGMFDGCTNLTDVSLIDFSDVTIGNSSFYWMFRNTAITAAPLLTVSNTNSTCCFGMFTGCSSMTTAANVHLNATTLSNYAYGEMFKGCSSLVTPPSFTQSPLTLDGRETMGAMFRECSSLTAAPSFEISSFGSSSVYSCLNMFMGCTSLVNASNIVLSAATLADGCFKYMFYNCSALTAAPEIQATAFSGSVNTNGCLAYMFANCSSLANIKVAFTSWTASGSSDIYSTGWVSGVAQSGVFECPSALPVTVDTSHIPTGWRVVNTDTNYALEYFGIEDESGSANTLTMRLSSTEGSAYYSTDDGTTWNTMPSSDTQITIPAGGRVIFKNTGYCEGWHFSATGAHSVNGNLDSLWNGDNFLQSGSEFQCPLCMEMFRYDTTLVHSKDLYVGAYTKGHYAGFVSMFDGCTGLLDVPDFSSFTQAGHYWVYSYMFNGCTRITEGLDFSNMVMEDWLQYETQCFDYMYYGCTSLNKAYAPKGTFWSWDLFNNWLGNVANSGVLYADSSNSSQIPTDEPSGCPTGWNIAAGGYIPYSTINGYLYANPLNQGDTLQYKVNSGSWQNYSAPIPFSSLNVGDVVTFKEVGASSGAVIDTSVTMAKTNLSSPKIKNTNGKTVTIEAISQPYAQASVYYTTDGSTPTEQSNLYTAPFDVASYSTTVKAKVIPANSTWYNASEQSSRTVTDVQKKFLVWNADYDESYYIRTGIRPTNNAKIRFACELFTDGGQCPWFALETYDYDNIRLGGDYQDRAINHTWGGSEYYNTYPNLAPLAARDVTLSKDGLVNNFTGAVISTDESEYSGDGELIVYISSVKFNRLQVWDTVNGSETLVFNGYAAVKSGMYGIYDAISGNFFTDYVNGEQHTWQSQDYGSAATVSNAISASSRFYTGGDFCARATTSQRTYTPITWYWYSRLGSSAPAADPYPDGHKVYSTADYGTADNIYCSVGTGHSGENITLKLVARIWGYEEDKCWRNITLTIPNAT